MGFVGEDALFGAAAASAFLTAQLLLFGSRSVDPFAPGSLDFVEQQVAAHQPVHSLLARGLALHPQM